MNLLNLREPPPGEASSASPEEDPHDKETVASVRRLLASREPPGLAGIRRFVRKPRPRLWKFGVGVWLWLVQIARWSADLLRWLGRGSGRVVRALRFAGFLGRRVQSFGARVGHWGRNWSGAHGRLGRIGERCAAFGERAVQRGAALAAFSDGASDLTERAARFLGEVVADPAADPVPGGAGSNPGPPSRPVARREAPATPPPAAVATQESAAPSPESSTPLPSDPPGPTPKPRPARARPPEPPPRPRSSRTAKTPPPLPDDVPAYLQLELGAVRQMSRPLPEIVRRLILQVTEARGWTRPSELAGWLGFGTNYLNRRYLAPMTRAGLVERRFPDRPSHPGQSYRAVRADGPVAAPDPQPRAATQDEGA